MSANDPLADPEVACDNQRMMAGFAKRLLVASIAGAVALLITFAVIFFGFLIWASESYPHDGQAGMSAFLLGVLIACPIAVITFAFTWSYRRGGN